MMLRISGQNTVITEQKKHSQTNTVTVPVMAAVFVIEWAECQTILFYMSWQTAIFLF